MALSSSRPRKALSAVLGGGVKKYSAKVGHQAAFHMCPGFQLSSFRGSKRKSGFGRGSVGTRARCWPAWGPVRHRHGRSDAGRNRFGRDEGGFGFAD